MLIIFLQNSYSVKTHAKKKGDGLKKRRRIPGKILIGLTGLLGAALSGSIPAEGRREMEAEASRFFLEEASRTFLAGMTYQEVDEIPAGTWIAGQAMQMIPVGMYVDSRFSVSTQVEDAQTYQMILAQQENDENAVDQARRLSTLPWKSCQIMNIFWGIFIQ